MKTLPILYTYKTPSQNFFDYSLSFTMSSSARVREFTPKSDRIIVDDWLPGAEIQFEFAFEIDLFELRRDCLLNPGDQIELLLVASHLGTRRSESFEFIFSPVDSNASTAVEFSPSPELMGRGLYLEAMILVTPDANPRNIMAAQERKSILWSVAHEVILEGTAPLAEVRSEKLGEALWKFEFSIPRDTSTWPQFEWNSVVKIIINADKRELILSSQELKALLFSELLLLIFQIVFDQQDGLDIVLGTKKAGTFLKETAKHVRSNFNVQDSQLDLIRVQWELNRSEILVNLQKNALKVIKMRQPHE